ncbi:hypothetical protein [Rhodococcus chondri]|uniref:Uncharacterized protein n=1 Tax=Rhodococcus chondri TaxID=3065941 RepID=A0ABU7JM69_9NOCA|nr:hypothetical protein [Rhodococcus sp. CC-R104]MEE2031126.1 hypothetical protein [Rhodococcus sp. CC-R104]
MASTSPDAASESATSLWSWRDRHGSEQFRAEDLAGLILDESADV